MPFIPVAVVGAGVATAFATGAAITAAGGAFMFFANAFLVNAFLGAALYGLAKANEPSGNFSGETRGRLQLVRSPIEARRVVLGEAKVSGTLVAYFFTDSTELKLALNLNFTIPPSLQIQVPQTDLIAGTSTVLNPVTIGQTEHATPIVSYLPFAEVASSPATSQFSVTTGGLYSFNAADVGKNVVLSHQYRSIVYAREWHWFVIAMAGHEVQEIGECFLNGDPVGTLTASGRSASGRFNGHVIIKKYLGTDTQTADPDLIAVSKGKWTSAHRGRGVAYAIVALRRNPDIFAAGAPNISFAVKGAKLYDTRDGITRWSNNPALARRWYLTWTNGLRCTSSEIDDTLVSAAANVADERVAMASHTVQFTADPATDIITFSSPEELIDRGDGVQVSSAGTLPAGLAAATTYYFVPLRDGTGGGKLATSYANALAGTVINITTAGSGIHTMSHVDQARYVLDGSFQLSEQPLNVIDGLQTADAGASVYSMGTWRLFSGAYVAPAVTLNENALAAPLEVQTRIARRDLFNAVRGTYVSPFKQWQPVDFPPVTNPTYEAQDAGEKIARDIQLPYTLNVVRAQRLGKIVLERSRQQISVSMPCNFTALKIAVCDTVQLTISSLGWTAKVFRVLGWQLNQNGLGVTLTLQEEAAAVYAWAAGNATTVDPAPDTELPTSVATNPPGSPVVTESQYSTSGSAGVKSRVTLTSTPSPDLFVVGYQFEYKLTSSAAWTVLPAVSVPTIAIDDVLPGIYDFRVKALTDVQPHITFYASTFGREIIGLSAPPSNVTNLTVRAIGGQAMVTLTQCPDLDVRIGGRLILRWSPKTAGASWNDGSLLNPPNSSGDPDGWPGDSVMVMAPLFGGTYLAKFRDSTGNYSVTEATFVVTEALLTGFSTLQTITESPDYLGTKTNVAAPEGALQLVGATLWDSLGLVDSLGNIDSLGGIVSTGSYAFATTMNLSSVKTARLFPNMQTLAFDTSDFWDDRTTPIDSWGLVDGSVIDDVEATLWVRTTLDDPTGAPTYGAWHPLPGPADYTFWGAQFRLDFMSADPTHNRKVTTLTVAAKQ